VISSQGLTFWGETSLPIWLRQETGFRWPLLGAERKEAPVSPSSRPFIR
jgi:hypothetical protein